MSKPTPHEELILVDSANRAVGRAEKLAAHTAGLRHRAFSIFLVDRRGQVLLQRRHRQKYHSGGLWANSCCGHPRPGEPTREAANRRLSEELSAKSSLRCAFRTRYVAELTGGLSENEIVYVYFGPAPTVWQANPAEISATDWMTLAALTRACRSRPDDFAFWLKHYVAHHPGEVERGIENARQRAPR